MYVSYRHGRYVLARWPGSGARHTCDCDHYEAPDNLTGLSAARGRAIIDDEATGLTTLKLGFALSRGQSRSDAQRDASAKPDVRAAGQKLSMRGLLHYLWDRAELTHWHPRMADKRNWFIVRRALLEAAANCKTSRLPLDEVLFVPERFRLDDKAALRARRRGTLERIYRSSDELMIIVGEAKEITSAHGATRIVLRHIADMGLLIDPALAGRFHDKFAGELALWQSQPDEGHMMLAGSIARRKEGTFELMDAALMPVTDEWLPYESSEEHTLIAKAVREQRRFVKGMRLDLDAAIPIASLLLRDTGDDATPVQICSFDAPTGFQGDGSGDICLWNDGDPLPPRARIRRADRREQAGQYPS